MRWILYEGDSSSLALGLGYNNLGLLETEASIVALIA